MTTARRYLVILCLGLSALLPRAARAMWNRVALRHGSTRSSVRLLPTTGSVPVARLKNVKPPVQVRASGTRTFFNAQERTAASFGDIIRTGAGGQADVLFSNGTQLALRENMQIEIAEPEAPRHSLVTRVARALSEVFVRPKRDAPVCLAGTIAAAQGMVLRL